MEICLLLEDLLRIAIQICSGLVYLAEMRLVHRDIAARNVLLTEDMIPKLSDFGLCISLGNQETVVETTGQFPIKYMPYESLKFGEFSEKSDVWSFGILMYEMFSSGEKPFPSILTEDLIDHLDNDGKPIFPEETPKELIDIFNDKCFQKAPNKRSTFIDLEYELDQFYSILFNVM